MADAIHKEMLRTISVLMTTAFAFVAGSAWNTAIQEFIPKGSAITSLLIYTIVVTIIAVAVTLFIGRLVGKVGIDIED